LSKLRIIVSVTNDLSTDQRVHKVCNVLHQQNYEVLLVGRLLPNSLEINDREYKTRRLKLWFNKGTLFYAEFQIRLLILLLFSNFDVAHANDLDTLLPNFLAVKIRRKHIVYDTHEYFTEVPELQQNPFKKSIWKFVEKSIFPKLEHVFTVNQSIAEIYHKLYGVAINVLRNVPNQNANIIDIELPAELKQKPFIILQGAGINIDRGAEELVEAMNYINAANLLIIGDGDVMPNLRRYVAESNLSSKVFFMPKKPYAELMAYTCKAAIGVTLDKDTNLNYKLSLPNKIFDYVRAEIPILASPLIETKRIFDEFNVGCLIPSHHPQDIADTINFMLSNEAPTIVWGKYLKQLSLETSWEKESEKLMELYGKF